MTPHLKENAPGIFILMGFLTFISMVIMVLGTILSAIFIGFGASLGVFIGGVVMFLICGRINRVLGAERYIEWK